MRYLPLLFLVVAACSKSKPAETTPPVTTDEHADHTDPEHGVDEHGEFASTPEVDAFHAHIAPLWHDETPERQAKTCKEAGMLLELSDHIDDAGMPAGAADDWGTRVSALMTSLMDLMDGCSSGTGDFETNFTIVHDNFHKVMEGLPKKS